MEICVITSIDIPATAIVKQFNLVLSWVPLREWRMPNETIDRSSHSEIVCCMLKVLCPSEVTMLESVRILFPAPGGHISQCTWTWLPAVQHWLAWWLHQPGVAMSPLSLGVMSPKECSPLLSPAWLLNGCKEFYKINHLTIVGLAEYCWLGLIKYYPTLRFITTFPL